MNPLLTATQLTFAYADRSVLAGVSLHVAAGELVGLVGPNGSGKTTLLRVLLGLLPAAGGEVALLGSQLLSLTRRQIALRAALVPQDTRLDFAFTGREVVAMGRTPHLGRFRPEAESDREAIRRAMRATDTEGFADRLATAVSGGERQRLHLARAVAQEAPLLLLDEPTAHLDVVHQLEMLALLRRLAREGKGVLAALHDLSLAARFCDRLLLLAGGRIRAAGPPAEVLTEDNLAAFFGLRALVRRDEATGDLFVWPVGPVHLPTPSDAEAPHA